MVSSEETPEGCFKGTAEEVRADCAGTEMGVPRCCLGPNSCAWPDTMTVTVCPMSCGGAKACWFLNPLLIQNQEIYIGGNSCRLAGSCKNFGAYMESSEPMTIGKGSCQGVESCNAAAGSVGDDSCKKDYSCQAMGGTVGKASCTESDSCLLAMGVGDCVETCDRLDHCEGTCQ
jgi:hypothetical protein